MRKTEIREDLIDQLAKMNKDISVYISLVDDYMNYWEIKEKLRKDIKVNGVRMEAVNGNGIKVSKINESVQQIPKITSTMLSILEKLGLKDPVAAQKETSIDDYC